MFISAIGYFFFTYNFLVNFDIKNTIFLGKFPSTYQEWASDINNDLEINVVDIVALVNMIFEQNYN